jgi:predicted AAA+ superfamily ATPase
MLEKLLLYNNLREDALVKKAVQLFYGTVNPGDELGEPPFDRALQLRNELYYDVQRSLLEFTKDDGGEISAATPTLWKHYICGLIAESDNIFSRQADKGRINERVFALAFREMPLLKDIYSLEWNVMALDFDDLISCVAVMLATEDNKGKKRMAIHTALAMEDDVESAKALADYYKREGCGIFESYDTFRWVGHGKSGNTGGLHGVERTDPVRFGDLIGYEIQKKKVIENVEFFIRGSAGINMLLYGDRGTGKSSCVKALLNMYSSEKLRLVALSKDEIGALPDVMASLSGSGCRFIIFIDDLSFEESETGYKSFKSALEGSVMPQPENIMVCVTSNRRNIIKEVWREREGREDINVNDALQEKRSLADRFGITVTFSAPDKREYLEIIKGIAAREKLGMDEETLIGEAMKWEIRQGGRSGRTARQFINYISRAGV